MLSWDTGSDEFEPGDWFRGRVYTRRCDLSPNGRYLVYFAAAFGSGAPGLSFGYSWTAISRSPALSPVGLWVKDDCWFGGGLFVDDQHVVLNERPRAGAERMTPPAMRIDLDDEARGEDEPIYARRLDRDGWRMVQRSVTKFTGRAFHTEQPEIRRKDGPDGSALHVERSVEGFTAREKFTLITTDDLLMPLQGATWADWDQRGRLVLARFGRILTATVTNGRLNEIELVDLNSLRPSD